MLSNFFHLNNERVAKYHVTQNKTKNTSQTSSIMLQSLKVRKLQMSYMTNFSSNAAGCKQLQRCVCKGGRVEEFSRLWNETVRF